MNNSEKGNFSFGISDKKIYICFFEKGKNYYKKKKLSFLDAEEIGKQIVELFKNNEASSKLKI